MSAPRSTLRARDAARFLYSGTKVMVRGATTLVRVSRGGHLRDTLRPWMRFQRVEEIPFELLAGQGVRGVLFDLENTLVPAGGPFTQDARDVLRRARAAGLGIAIVTNASGTWVGPALGAEGVPFIAPAAKPGSDGFLEACRRMGIRPAQAVFVGDQMITDVFGAQRAGMRAILVEPRYETEFWSSKFQRAVSKGLLRVLRGA